MKKLLLLFFFSIFFLISQAQTSVYHPFPDSDVVWRENYQSAVSGGCCCSADACITDEQYEYFIDGDTLIGSYSYGKVFKSGNGKHCDSGPSTCPPGCTPCYYYSIYLQYAGAIRQDIALRKIFYFPSNSSLEVLLYDFNLNVGDTLSPSYINSSTWNTKVSSIDSILIGTSYNKRFWLSASGVNNFASIIEGIGGTYGLLSDLHPPFEHASHLLCVTINSIPVYPDTATVCALASNSEKIIYKNSISIFPNPASDKITISNYSFSGKKARVEIYNMMGEQIKPLQTISNNLKPETTMDVSNLTAGVYLVEVTDGEKIVRSKIIKQ